MSEQIALHVLAGMDHPYGPGHAPVKINPTVNRANDLVAALGCSKGVTEDSRRLRHQKLAADAPAQHVHALQELRQIGVQASGQDFVNAAIRQLSA